MVDLDAVTKYWLELKPQTRLGYCLISHTEKALLEAMCCYSTEGAAVERSLDVLARRAGMTRKTAQRLLNGYKHGSRVISGLKAKGVVSAQAPSQTKKGKKTKPAVLHINWEALALDPSKRHILIQRMQQTLPGMNTRPVPEEDAGAASEKVRGKAVEPPQHPGQRVQPPWTACPPYPGHSVHPTLDNLSTQDFGFGLGLSGKGLDNSSSASNDRGVVKIHPAGEEKGAVKKPFSTKPKSSWSTLNAGIRSRIERELSLIAEGELGLNTHDWTAEQIARHRSANMRRACERAGIWAHVTEDLAAEEYAVAMREQRERTN